MPRPFMFLRFFDRFFAGFEPVGIGAFGVFTRKVWADYAIINAAPSLARM